MPYQFLPEWPGEVTKHATVADSDFYRHVTFIDMSPDEFGTDPHLISKSTGGRWVTPETVPTEAVFGARKGTKIPDVMQMDGSFFCVSERLKGLIEGLEPGVHQFLPMTYRWKDGSLAEERWLFVCGNRIRAISDQSTAPRTKKGQWIPGEGGELVFDRKKNADKHFWVCSDLVGDFVEMDDEAHRIFVDEGVTGLKLGADRHDPAA